MKWIFPDPTTADSGQLIYAEDCWKSLIETTAEAAAEDPNAAYLACVVHAVGELFKGEIDRRAVEFFELAGADVVANAEALLTKPDDVPDGG